MNRLFSARRGSGSRSLHGRNRRKHGRAGRSALGLRQCKVESLEQRTLLSIEGPRFYPEPVLPPANGMYNSDFASFASFAGGIIIRNFSERVPTASITPPAPGAPATTHAFGSQVEFEVSTDGGDVWHPIVATANATMQLQYQAPQGEDDVYACQMLQLDVATGGPLGLMIRESPTRASGGQTTVKAVPGGYMIDSFFDIWVEISVDGGGSWVASTQPGHVKLRPDPSTVASMTAATQLLPSPTGKYQSTGDKWLETASGIILKDVREELFSGSVLPPPLGMTSTHTFDSQLDFMVSMDGGAHYSVGRAPAAMTVKYERTRDFSGRATYETEVMRLDVAGGDLPGGIMIRESPTKASLGGMSVVAGGGGGAMISSFFDIYIEVSTDGGGSWQTAIIAPGRLEAQAIDLPDPFPTPNLPPLTGEYVGLAGRHGRYGNGIMVKDVVHRAFTASFPPPAAGITETHTFGSQVEMDVSTDGGTTFARMAAPASTTVKITGSQDSGGTRYFDTEMLQLNISGGDLPAGVMIRESPTKASRGRTSVTTSGADNDCDSFFDIYTEVSTDGGQNWTPMVTGPVTVVLQTAAAPVAVAMALPNPAGVGHMVTFDASDSYHEDPSHGIVRYEWDFDSDGIYDAEGQVVMRSFSAPGNRPVGLRVTDNNVPAKTATDTVLVVVQPNAQVKWEQPPVPVSPENLYYGWNETSWYGDGQIAADDWLCTTVAPVTEIAWWGSFKDWTGSGLPSVQPSSFVFSVWTDVPANPQLPDAFSHPGEVIWQREYPFNPVVSFEGWDYDPRTQTYEACYKFDQVLPQSDWFYQAAGPVANIFWLSIAATYPDVVVDHPFGWKTRPRDPNSPAPDAAVRIFDPVSPATGSVFVKGQPLYWPTREQSWDLAFQLTTQDVSYKWRQQPDLTTYGIDVADSRTPTPPVLLADDFQCTSTGYLTQITVCGSWYHDLLPNNDPTNVSFTLSIHDNVPVGPNGYSQPGAVKWYRTFTSSSFTVRPVAQGNEEGWITPPSVYEFPADHICWEYTFNIPESMAFLQQGAPDKPITYWLDVQATPLQPSTAKFGWKTSPDHWMDAATWVNAVEPYAGNWNKLVYPLQHPYQGRNIDLAFSLNGTVQSYPKWVQPPVPYTPQDAFSGWDERSAYRSGPIVADDWRCTTADPVTDIHWWGSFLNWDKPVAPEAQLPQAFHIGIWTDVPGQAGSFSHPGKMIWENYCTSYSTEFVGWDFDPRYPGKAPEAKFYFSQDLPRGQWFYQEGANNIYWVSISAVYQITPMNPFGWETRPHNFQDDAVRITNPLAPQVGSSYVSGNPIEDLAGNSWDMSFVLTTLHEDRLDFGDAPELPGAVSYPTTLANNGARHVISSTGPWLGNVAPDAEADGQPDPAALGDDNNGVDDEDGVNIPVLVQGAPTNVTFTVSGATANGAVVEGWIDFNGNKMWEAAELVVSGTYVNGAHTKSVTAPVGSVVGQTFARFRISAAGTGAPTGLAPNGEVEDYLVKIEEPRWDFGDAPDGMTAPGYPTLLWNNGARHALGSGFFLGNRVDAEPDGQPTLAADGDDLNPPAGLDDEDGVTFNTALFSNVPNTITVTATMPVGAAAFLNAWIDLNGDGDWADLGEQVLVDQNIANGTNSYTFTPGAITATGKTYARFRLSQQAGLSYAGPARDGEVEDYRIDIAPVKWLQRPDLTPYGVDVDNYWVQLADDFRCTMSGPITDLHVWTSFAGDIVPKDLTSIPFTLYIYADVPAGPNNLYSRPGSLLWSRNFAPGAYTAGLCMKVPQGEWWFDPATNSWHFPGDHEIYQYDFAVPRDEAFRQLEGTVYWLGLKYRASDNDDFTLGWKSSYYHWNDDATWLDTSMPVPTWKELRYGDGHPMQGQSMDLAFATTGVYEEPKLDFGDAPEGLVPGYPTLLISNGARHVITSAGPWLGNVAPDAEADGQSDPAALGDDNNWVDDEDGVNIPVLVQGAPTNVTFTVSGASANGAVVEGWIDFNGNKIWEAAELVVSGTYVNGTHTKSVTAPVGSVVGQTFARFRISTVGTGAPTGLARDGEVEDYLVKMEEPRWDFGDAPDGLAAPRYPTLLWNNGARHALGSGFFLGNLVDAEPDGQPTPAADGDDLNPPVGFDDEDGVTFNTALFSNVPNTITVTATMPIGAAAFLNAWIDLNGDGDWADLGEQVLVDQNIGNGANSYTFTPGAITATGKTYARFRLSQQAGLSYAGPARDGEVEDYRIDIAPVKWLQRPDVSSYGVDVDNGWVQLADDFRCTMSGPITDIHIWTSFAGDDVPRDLTSIPFTLYLYADVPDPNPSDPSNWSHPGQLLWSRNFAPGAYTAGLCMKVPEGEWWFDPATNSWHFPGDHEIYQYDFTVPREEAFRQREGTVYWLGVKSQALGADASLGWKSSYYHWNDDATWLDTSGAAPMWRELRYGDNHPMARDSMDLAFAITGVYEAPKELDFGDAPDPTYPTLLVNDGARHIITGPWLGDRTDRPDSENNGQPDPSALGDDLNPLFGLDDEDGATVVNGPAEVEFVTNGDFEGGFTNQGLSGPLDGQPDDVPNNWTRFETFSGGVVENSKIAAYAGNGPSAPGSAAAHFERSLGGASGDWTVVDQVLNINAADYGALTLSLDAMVVSHNLPAGGWVAPAFEWPVVCQVDYVATDGTSQTWRYGWYIDPPGDDSGSPIVDPGSGLIAEYRDLLVQPGVWTPTSFDLFQELPLVRTVTNIRVGGSGWSYEGNVDNVSLRGVPSAPGGELIVNGDFQQPFAAAGVSGPLDGAADSLPSNWTRVETFSGGVVENSTIGPTAGPGGAGDTAASFLRTLGGSSGDWTAIQQSLNIHAADYGALNLSLDTRVISHDLPAGGWVNPSFEWPVICEVDYVATDGTAQVWRFGWYVDPPGDDGGSPMHDPGSGLIPEYKDMLVVPGAWNHTTFDLLQELPQVKTITNIRVGGSGWSFEGSVDNVSITGARRIAGNQLIQGVPGYVAVRVNGGGGYLDGWVDTNGNGAWDATEQIVSGWHENGQYLIPVTVPVGGASGKAFARFRINKEGDISTTGQAASGEVEDHALAVQQRLDFGDARDARGGNPTGNPYPTLLEHDGARHVAAGPWLGPVNDSPDWEAEGQPTADSQGDDLGARDDEDGLRTWVEGPVFNSEFAGGFYNPGTSGPLDGTADSVPSGWWRYEIFSGGVVENSGIGAATGPHGTGDAAVSFVRTAGGMSGDWTAIQQTVHLGDSVSAYQSLVLSLDTKVISHDLEAGGWVTPAFEWPVVVEVKYIDALGNLQTWRHGWYVDPPGDGARIVDPGSGLIAEYKDTQVLPGVWTHNQFDLLAELPQANYITNILVGGSGWNFEGQVDNVSIVATRKYAVVYPGADNLTIEVNGGGGYVDAWVDWNGDGDWADAGERIASGWYADGIHNIAVTVPDTPMYTTARFRINSQADLGLTGLAGDGEVEDWQVLIARAGQGYDYGDAPASYGTLAADNGARHYVGGPFLGTVAPDVEANGQPSSGAQGDDTNGADDEDGVTVPALIQGLPGTFTVRVNGGGYLDGWVDLDGNGTWDAAEKIVSGWHDPGTYNISVTVPIGGALGTTFARFRINSYADLAEPIGAVSSGEVEDYAVTVGLGDDWGDAPDSATGMYPTLAVHNGARHKIVRGFHLGASVDAERDGQPTLAANGDDVNGLPDEDGVINATSLVQGCPATVTVVASAAGMLDAWIDYNGDGDWADAGEQVAVSVPLAAGPNNLPFTVPATALPGNTYARLRFSRTGGLSYFNPDGAPIPDGEVEDYQIDIEKAKWVQPPEPTQPDNFYYGWNEPSIHERGPIAADDWVCTTADPVSGIRWWGSFLNWRESTPPDLRPSQFHLAVWTDVPQGPNNLFSHPGTVVWEADVTGYTSQFVGWDFDPRSQTYEACFQFNVTLPREQWFHQPGDKAIYWVSIAASYPQSVPQYPFGWKTRPRDSTSLAPDAAVGGLAPAGAHIGDVFQGGYPLQWRGQPYDLAFELTTTHVVEKQQQLPDLTPTGIDVRDVLPVQRLADDFKCTTPGPLTQIEIWGSWWHNLVQDPGLVTFTLSIHADIPDPDGGGPLYSMPGQVLWSSVFQPGSFTWQFVSEGPEGWLNPPQDFEFPGDSLCFKYVFSIDSARAFRQVGTPERPVVYWLDVQATSMLSEQLFGWKTSLDHWNDDAVYMDPSGAAWKELRYPPPHQFAGRSIDLAFRVSTQETAVKWTQPPAAYTPPNLYNGWDERSVYGMEPIVADDWVCTTAQPISDIHWWGSFLGWQYPQLPPEEVLPERFHIAIWTDVPADPGQVGSFSHPGKVVWETFAPMDSINAQFVGWDVDPREQSRGGPEPKFSFDYQLPLREWFRQQPGQHIYWVSIAAVYPNVEPGAFPFGWETRPRNPESSAPDDAVRINVPTHPHVGDSYQLGEPIWWPTPKDSWDMSFALTTGRRVWDGGSLATDGWIDNVNWTGDVAPVPGDSLEFPDVALRKSHKNDFAAGTGFGSIDFSGGGYHIANQPLGLDGGITNAMTVVGNNVVDLDIRLDDSQTFTNNSGASTLAINKSVDVQGNALTLDGPGAIRLGSPTSVISGAGTLTKEGGGTTTLRGNNTYSGGTTVNQGTLVVASTGALPAGRSLTIAAGGTVVLSSGLGVAPSDYETVDSQVGGGPMSLGFTGTGWDPALKRWTISLTATNNSPADTLEDVHFVQQFLWDNTVPTNKVAFAWNNAARRWELAAKAWTFTTYGVRGQNELMSMDRAKVDTPLSWTPSSGGQTATVLATDSLPALGLGDFAPGQVKNFTLYADVSQQYPFSTVGFFVALPQLPTGGAALGASTAVAGSGHVGREITVKVDSGETLAGGVDQALAASIATSGPVEVAVAPAAVAESSRGARSDVRPAVSTESVTPRRASTAHDAAIQAAAGAPLTSDLSWLWGSELAARSKKKDAPAPPAVDLVLATL